MKKIFFFVVLFFSFTLQPRALSIDAKSYVLMDLDSNRVILSKDKDNPMLIASISKIMTCIIAIENGFLDDQVTADKGILKMTGSSIYLEVGETLSLKDLLYGMMLRSGNDAAYLIAMQISGSMENFAMLMNEYAKKIGMKNTIFYNSHGLEEDSGLGNTSSAYDMALLTSYALKNATFREIFGCKSYTVKSNLKTHTWQNKNKLLKYDYITGGKTGYTKKAKRTLVSSADVNDMHLVVVTLNDPSDWQDHINLYQKIKKEYQKFVIVDKENFALQDKYLNIGDKLYIKKSYSMILKNDKNISVQYFLYDKENYRNNDVVGYFKIYENKEVIYEDNIYIKKKKVSKIKKWWQNIFS